MSGYDSVNRNVLSRVRKVARDGADVTSGGRQFHTLGPATENAQLPTVNKAFNPLHKQSRNFCFIQPATAILPDDIITRYLQLCLCSLQPHRESYESLSDIIIIITVIIIKAIYIAQNR